MICPSDHARSQKHLAILVFSGQDTALHGYFWKCPSIADVMPQVGHAEALKTLDVSHRPTSHTRSRVRVHTHVHVRVKVGLWDTSSNGAALLRPTCGTTLFKDGRNEQT